jgi:hypothetical protein
MTKLLFAVLTIPVSTLAQKFAWDVWRLIFTLTGTESQTVPLGANTQTTEPLTCPAASQYYQWKGKPTSAQYYVNPKGVSTEVGCQWSDGSRPIGNFAPINLGVGENNGKWLSIFQNSPTTNEHLDFNIKIQGENLSGSCRYENGKYYSLTGSNDSGCTVCLLLFRPVSWNLLTGYPTGRGPLWRCLLRLLLSQTRARIVFWLWPGDVAYDVGAFAARIKISRSMCLFSSVYLTKLSCVTWRWAMLHSASPCASLESL